MNRLCAFVLLLIANLTGPAFSQGRKADYERANGLRKLFTDKVHKAQLRPQWLEGERFFWYRTDVRGVREFVLVDAEEGLKGPAFDHARLAESLAALLGKEVPATALPFERIGFDEDRSTLSFRVEKERYECDLESYECSSLGPAEEEADEQVERPRTGNRGGPRSSRGRGGPARSPDGRWEVVTEDHNLILRTAEEEDADGGPDETPAITRPLTTDGTPERSWQRPVWSPDSRTVVGWAGTPGDVKDVYRIETSPKDQLEAKLHQRPYARVTDTFPTFEMHLFDAESGTSLNVDATPDDQRPPRLRWSEDGTRFTYEKRDRGHQRNRVMEVTVATGATRALIDEQAETFIDDYHKYYVNYVNDGAEILWFSERDGWNHLYLYDGVTGVLKNQVTWGQWLVRGVDSVDEEARQIWFRASGMQPDQDPYFIHHYRIDFDGQNLVTLTEGDGTHTVHYSPGRKYLIDTWSRVDLPPVHVLRRTSDGSLVCPLEEADVRDLEAVGWRPPKVFHAKGRDGDTDIWGIVHYPMDYDPNQTYPVVESIYAGPHDSHVPKSFRAYRSQQTLAELGFVVVQIDGMGTNNRSKAFLDVCWKNLADAGFPDRKLWIQALATQDPSLDLTRVGIYGTSAGGQNALGALLFHPEFYHAAMAACGCHDNRLDKASWNEQWMGWPIGPHYEEQSNITHADKLEGKLLLILGELDTNVPPESTWRVVDALIQADKDFDLLVIPGAGHTNGGTYGWRRTQDFFVRTFLGVEPRWVGEDLPVR